MSKEPIHLMLDRVEWQVLPPMTSFDRDGNMPHATHKGVLNIMGVEMTCYQLSNGQRVFDADSIERFFGCTRDEFLGALATTSTSAVDGQVQIWDRDNPPPPEVRAEFDRQAEPPVGALKFQPRYGDPDHDMLDGPCKCGAWHESAGRNRDSKSGERNPTKGIHPPSNRLEIDAASPDESLTGTGVFEKIDYLPAPLTSQNSSRDQALRENHTDNREGAGSSSDSSSSRPEPMPDPSPLRGGGSASANRAGPTLRQNDIDRLAREVAKARGGEGQ